MGKRNGGGRNERRKEFPLWRNHGYFTVFLWCLVLSRAVTNHKLVTLLLLFTSGVDCVIERQQRRPGSSVSVQYNYFCDDLTAAKWLQRRHDWQSGFWPLAVSRFTAIMLTSRFFRTGDGSPSATNVVLLVVVVTRFNSLRICSCSTDRYAFFTHIKDNILHQATVAEFWFSSN